MQSKTRRTITLALSGLAVSVAAAVPTGNEPQTRSELTEKALAKMATEMQKEVEALRGWKFKRPVDVGLYTEEQVRAFLQSDRLDEADGWGEQARRLASKKMIGLVPQDCDPAKMFEDMMMSFVPGGIYDHKAKALRVTKKAGVGRGSLGVRVTLVHELIHALDDQHFDFTRMEEEGGATSDVDHVWGAVFEGSAVVAQERYTAKVKHSNEFDSSEFQKNMKEAMEQMRALSKAPVYVTVWFARFPCGVRFLFRGDRMAAMALMTGSHDPGSVSDAVRTVGTNLPRSSEQILHPEKYWQDDQRDEPVVVNDEDVEKMLNADGFRVIDTDTVGELLCAVLTSPEDKKLNPMAMGMPDYWTSAAAAGWGGDRFFLLTSGTDKETITKQPEDLYGAWFTLWDTPADRDEFIAGYEAHRTLSSRTVLKLGTLGAVHLFGFDSAQRDGLEKRLRTAPPKCTRDGKPWCFDGAGPRRDAQGLDA